MYETEKRPIDTENNLMVPKGEDRARDKLGFGDSKIKTTMHTTDKQQEFTV